MNDQINKLISRVFSDKISPSSKKDKNIDLSDIIDSFSVIEIILALEEEFKIKIKIDDINLESFSSTKSIKVLINKIKNAP
tara:strand:- start:155 stop:397 length:243 start_codon:yes stop_codon:yes gene_type:complete